MEEKRRFRITSEEIGGDYKDSIECSGFVILSNKNEGAAGEWIHDISVAEIASIIACTDKTYQAALIAKGMYEAATYAEAKHKRDMFNKFIIGTED